jgi:hypothetical protein
MKAYRQALLFQKPAFFGSSQNIVGKVESRYVMIREPCSVFRSKTESGSGNSQNGGILLPARRRRPMLAASSRRVSIWPTAIFWRAVTVLPIRAEAGAVINEGVIHAMPGGVVALIVPRTAARGTWLIDPTDFTVAASGGDISGAMLGSNLSATNVTIQSSSGAIAGNGDIFVNDTVSWSANMLTLDAYRNIMVNREMNGWQHRRRQHQRPRQPSRRQ